MVKRHALIAVLIALSLLLSACDPAASGSGKMATQSREVRGVDRVSLTSQGEVILTQGERESLTVESDDNIIKYVKTEESLGELVLGLDPKGMLGVFPTQLKFYLTVVDLDRIELTGSGKINVDQFETECLEVDVSGSGNVRIDALSAQEAEVRISGSGGVDMAGQVSEQLVDLIGSGNYLGGDLRSETTKVYVSGSGGATLWVTESLDARMTGSGSVDYYGNPRTDVSGSGSGKVRGLGDK